MFENVLTKKIVIGNRKDEECFHVAFGITSNYTRPIGVLMTSIMKNTISADFVFHIIVDGLVDDTELNRFKRLADEYNVEICIYYFKNDIFKGLDDKEFTIAAYYRFAIPTLLQSRTHRFLYLDADVLVIKDLNLFKDINLDGKIAAVVREFSIQDDRGFDLKYNNDFYFNSGMMYVDIPRWINEKVSEKCMEILREVNRDETQKKKYGYSFQCFDQDALNIVLKGKTKIVEPKYNFLTNISLKRNKNLLTVPDDTVIIHYHGFNKPWHEWCFHELNKYYRKAALSSPWADVPWDNKPSKYRQMRLYSKYYLKKGDILNSIKWVLKSIKSKGVNS